MYSLKKWFQIYFKVIQNVLQKYGNFFQKTIGFSKITCNIAFQITTCPNYVLLNFRIA